MLAHLLIVLLTGAGPIGIQLPFRDMASCEAWIADPAPVVVFRARPVQMQCVDAPTDPGKPV